MGGSDWIQEAPPPHELFELYFVMACSSAAGLNKATRWLRSQQGSQAAKSTCRSIRATRIDLASKYSTAIWHPHVLLRTRPIPYPALWILLPPPLATCMQRKRIAPGHLAVHSITLRVPASARSSLCWSATSWSVQHTLIWIVIADPGSQEDSVNQCSDARAPSLAGIPH